MSQVTKLSKGAAGCFYSRAAEKGCSRKLGFRCMRFSETKLPEIPILGNLELPLLPFLGNPPPISEYPIYTLHQTFRSSLLPDIVEV
jgi:hypothetical protein